MVNVSFVGALIGGLMYSDKADVYRFEDVTASNGSTKTKLPSTPTYSGLSCKVSQPLRSWDRFRNDSPDTVPYEKQPKVFFYLDADIREGDYIIASKMKGSQVIKTYEGQCNLPAVLSTHQEVVLNTYGDD